MAKPTIYSWARDLLSHKTERVGQHGVHVVFDYPDCTRTYDGREWHIVAKPAFIRSLDSRLMRVSEANFFKGTDFGAGRN